MGTGLDHPGDHEVLHAAGPVLDLLDLQAQHGQPLGDLGQAGIGVQV